MKLRVLLRLLEIQRVLVKYRLAELLPQTRSLRSLRALFYLSPFTWFQSKSRHPRAQRLRLALEELGPVFMKFGQMISTRRDLLPEDIADELAKLQDCVPPFPSAIARQIAEQAYARPIDEVFASFDEQPLAAATIAQVHVARLHTGADVIVKIVRPGIRAAIERDIEVLYVLADVPRRYWADAHRLRPLEVVHEYEKTILDELDLMREAANAAQLRRNFEGSRLLYVPAIHWDYCRKNVMVMERIHGVLISNIAELKRRGVNIRRLAENGVEIFFTQVFRHNFFHADMHPGNIFVLTEDPEYPRYAAIDFGIVGTLDVRDQHYLAENFLAFFNRDYRRVAQLHVDSGWVPPGTRVDEFESAVRTVCEPIFNKPLGEISFGQVLLRLFETAQRFNMTVQPQLTFLQKTLLQIEGLGRQLYPELDLWKTAQPILREWMYERLGWRGTLASLRRQWPDLNEALKKLPQLFSQTVTQMSEGRHHVRIEQPQLDELRREIRRSASARDITIVASVVLGSGIVWLAIGPQPLWIAAGLCAAGLLGLFLRRR